MFRDVMVPKIYTSLSIHLAFLDRISQSGENACKVYLPSVHLTYGSAGHEVSSTTFTSQELFHFTPQTLYLCYLFPTLWCLYYYVQRTQCVQWYALDTLFPSISYSRKQHWIKNHIALPCTRSLQYYITPHTVISSLPRYITQSTQNSITVSHHSTLRVLHSTP